MQAEERQQRGGHHAQVAVAHVPRRGYFPRGGGRAARGSNAAACRQPYSKQGEGGRGKEKRGVSCALVGQPGAPAGTSTPAAAGAA
jgi:RNA 3'-terminal phosphate cyclase